MKVEGYMRGVAMDPLGQYAAAATADGQLLLWDLEPLKEPGGKVKDELKKSITCKVKLPHNSDIQHLAASEETTLAAAHQ